MAEYIERERFAMNVLGLTVVDPSVAQYSEAVLQCLKDSPTADVAPVVHAQPVLFFDDPFTGRRFTTCSNCDGKIGKRDRYCRHCGAKMDGGTL